MPKKPVIKGLYVITPDGLTTDELLRRARLAIQGGASVLQYRNKSANREVSEEQAQVLRALTQKFSVPLIINDDIALVMKVDADGVHLGADDNTISEARTLLGEGKLIGASCYNRLELAVSAAQQGTDYVAFGAFYQSDVKPNAVKAEMSLLRRARTELQIPIVAIGGITAQNGAMLVEAGADALAVVSAVFAAPDTASAAKEFYKLFEQGKTA